MNLTKRLELGVSGHEDIDFIDVNLLTDTELYLDPTLIEELPTKFCVQAKTVLCDFFEVAFKSCLKKDYKKLYELVSFGREPNETKLGLSVGRSQGKGSKPENLYKVFRQVAEQSLVQKGIIQNSSDLCVFVSNFAEDRMSDLITNILRKELYQFTKNQCKKHKIKLSESKQNIGKYWDNLSHEWRSIVTFPLIINNEKILLVPKVIVRKKYIVSVSQYLQKHVLTHRQKFHLEKRTAMAHVKYDKYNNPYYVSPTKEEIYAKEVKGHDHKKFVLDFTNENPEIVDEFRRKRSQEKDIWEHVYTDYQLDYYVYKRKKLTIKKKHVG